MNIETLHTNQKLLLKELISRGATWEMIDEFEELIAIRFNGKTEYLLDRFSSKAPFSMVKVTADKHLAKQIMKANGISVPDGAVFTGQKLSKIPEFAKDKYPLVLKPNWGSHGDHVQVDIRNQEALVKAIKKFCNETSNDTPFILEDFKPWREHRFLITALGEFAVVLRDPASVVGDGLNSVFKLVSQENYLRKRKKESGASSLCQIVLDDEVRRYLDQQGKSWEDVPQRGVKFYLRQESNLAKGGMAIDITKRVHPSFLEVAKKALASFPGLPCVGLDILAEDISYEAKDNNYVIIEANSSPGLAMHTYPSFGNPENVAAMIANVMFKDFFKDENEN